MTPTLRHRARQRLDERLHILKEADLSAPPKGWIKAIREALGMTGAQFAARLSIRPPSVVDLEKSEASGSIQLKTLNRVAEALDCRLVYALVPKTSLQETIDTRARRIAMRDLKRVGHTMKLEDQSVGAADMEARIEAYIREHINERDLWAGRD